MSDLTNISDNFLVSIIIRCYNEEEHIGRLLAGISSQLYSNYEIILVDSGSTDATLSIASQFPIKLVYIHPEEFTFGRALNFGIKESKGDICVLISAHCYPIYSDWLSELVQPFDNPDVALVYGRQIGDKTTQFSENRIFSNCFPEKSDFNQFHPFCNNANTAIRKNIWEKIPYNEELSGLEDIEWAKKALESKYRIVYNAKAVIVHKHNETPWQIKNRHYREARAMKKIYPHESFPLTSALYLIFTNIISDLLIAVKFDFFFTNIRKIVTFRLMQFYGTYLGYNSPDILPEGIRRNMYYPNRYNNNNRFIHNEENNNKLIDYSKGEKY